MSDKKGVTIWGLKGLVESSERDQAQINGKWVPARPVGLLGMSGLLNRLKAAKLVFDGKADAVKWPEGQ